MLEAKERTMEKIVLPPDEVYLAKAIEDAERLLNGLV